MPARQQVVPKITFVKMLERALSPPDESMVLPYSKCVSVCMPMWDLGLPVASLLHPCVRANFARV